MFEIENQDTNVLENYAVYRAIQKSVTVLVLCHPHKKWPKQFMLGHVDYNICRFQLTKKQTAMIFSLEGKTQNRLFVLEQIEATISRALHRLRHKNSRFT